MDDGGESRKLFAESVVNQEYQRAAGYRSGYGDATAGVQTLQPLLGVQLTQRPEERRSRSSRSPRTKFLLRLNGALDCIRREQHEVI